MLLVNVPLKTFLLRAQEDRHTQTIFSHFLTYYFFCLFLTTLFLDLVWASTCSYAQFHGELIKSSFKAMLLDIRSNENMD